MLQNNIEPTDNSKKNPYLGIQKRNFQISYDLTSTTDFPSSNKKNQNFLLPIKTMRPLVIKQVNYLT